MGNIRELDKSEQNAVIEKIFMDYLRTNAPGFSLLLRGPWGCGKTFFVKTIIDKLKEENITVLYVSLSGVSSKAEIDERLIAAIWGKPEANILLRLSQYGRGILSLLGEKNILNVRLLGDKLEAFANKKALKNAKSFAIVFDDIERCDLELTQWIGYIRTLTETFQTPVVYVGNEGEIKDFCVYTKIKEKFVGQTYELAPETEHIVPILLSQATASSTIGTLSDSLHNKLEHFCIFLLKALYDARGCHNYRALQATFWHLSFWMNNLKDIFDKREDLAFHFSCIFLALAYPHQLGITPKGNWVSEISKSGDTHPSPNDTPYTFIDAAKCCSEYDGAFFGYGINVNVLLPLEQWEQVIKAKTVPTEVVRSALENSSYLRKEPAWKGLLQFRYRNDTEVKEALRLTKQALKNKEIVDSSEIRLVFRLMEQYERVCVHAKQCCDPMDTQTKASWENRKQELYNQFKDYLDDLYNSGKLIVTPVVSPYEDGYAGYLFFEPLEKDSSYPKLCETVNELYLNKQQTDFEQTMADIHTQNDLPHFCTIILKSDLKNKPFPSFTEEATLRAHLLHLLWNSSVPALTAFSTFIDERYLVNILNWQKYLPSFKAELPMWQTLVKELKEARTSHYVKHKDSPIWITAMETTIEKMEKQVIERIGSVTKA